MGSLRRNHEEHSFDCPRPGVMRVRFAPSPTGHLHVGSVRTALFNWLLARHEKGTFILRIEDTDRERSKTEYLNALLEDLRWLGLTWDEGPFFQSERLETYRHHLRELLDNGSAYPCYCAPEELARKRELAQREKRAPGYDGACRKLSQAERNELEKQGARPAIRFRSPAEQKLTVHDCIRGAVDFSSELLEDFVIFKSDGFPVYNLACVIDDHLMNITHVLRGEEHLSNTPRQLLIYQAFHWTPPVFGHLSIILNENRKKLSKREGATYLSEFREAGFLPEALLNFLALLGWAPGHDLEIMPIQEIIERFSIEGIGKSPAIFDFKKLEWMNSQYIKQLSPEELALRLKPFLEKAGYAHHELQPEWIAKLAGLFNERLKTLSQFTSEASYFLADNVEVNPEAAAKILTRPSLEWVRELIPILKTIPFNESELETAIRNFAEAKGGQAKDLIHPLRLLLTGKTVSPGIFQVMALLGKEKTIARLEKEVCTRNSS